MYLAIKMRNYEAIKVLLKVINSNWREFEGSEQERKSCSSSSSDSPAAESCHSVDSDGDGVDRPLIYRTDWFIRNYIGAEDRTYLHWAVFCHTYDLKLFEIFIGMKAKLDMVDGKGFTVLGLCEYQLE